MPLAMCLSRNVLPALGGETISARWPLPSGLTRLISRVEIGSPLGRLWIDPIDRLDPHQAPVLLAVLGLADGAAHAVARAQAETPDRRRRDVDIVQAGHKAVPAQEAVAVVDDVEDAGHVDRATTLDLALQDALDQVVLAHLGRVGEAQLAADMDQLVEVLALEFVDVHRGIRSTCSKWVAGQETRGERRPGGDETRMARATYDRPSGRSGGGSGSAPILARAERRSSRARWCGVQLW